MKRINDASLIRDISDQLCPDLKQIIWHDSPITASTWNAGLETGKAVEMLTFFALIAAFREAGSEVSFPELYVTNPDLFFLRNIIPRHHGAQPGHDAVIGLELPLFDRFHAAMTPKATVKTQDDRTFLIYREGNPIHLMTFLIKYGSEYYDRPDFLITEGEIQLNFENLTELPFVYTHPMGRVEGSLRIKNDAKIPLISLDIFGSSEIPTNGIIECSVGKGKEKASDQIAKYQKLYATSIRPISILINGQRKSCSAFDHEILIDLTTEGVPLLAKQLVNGMRQLAENLCSTS